MAFENFHLISLPPPSAHLNITSPSPHVYFPSCCSFVVLCFLCISFCFPCANCFLPQRQSEASKYALVTRGSSVHYDDAQITHTHTLTHTLAHRIVH